MKTVKLSLRLFLSAHLLTTAVVMSVIPLQAKAQAPSCSAIFNGEQGLAPGVVKTAAKTPQELTADLEAHYQSRNAILVKRYPQLEFVFKDPEAFVKTMKDRFEEQKKITPEDPRLFNFPEAASTMKEIKGDLEKFRQELIADLQKEKSSLKNRLSHAVLGKRSARNENITKVLQYISKLQTDIDGMISSNNYPYRDTVYTLYYYSRVRGFFQFKELGTYYQVAKYVDMVMHGYRRLNIDSELQLYRQKGSPIVQVRSGKIASEFRTAELPFRDAFERTDTLEYVVIPSVYALGSSAFLHVLPHKIHFLGATNTPIPADGFNRPGGLFWMHDVRHEADRYMKINAYRKAQNLTKQQDRVLTLQMHQWHSDFLKMKNNIQDPNLKASLEHYHFYTHHDIGIPLIPSMFLNHHKDGMEVYYSFLYHKKFSGQTPEFKEWFKITKQTQDILTQFWTERLPQERQILQKNPVQIKNWEEWFPMSHRDATSAVALYNKAIEGESLVRMNTGSTSIEGTLSKVIYNAQGEASYVVFGGKAQLTNREGQVIPGQGPSVHGQGYSTPIGPIKSVTISGREVDLVNLRENQIIEMQYESGVQVQGEVKKVTYDEGGNLAIITFSSAEVRMNDKQLYKPEWGSYDLILGDKVQSLEFL